MNKCLYCSQQLHINEEGDYHTTCARKFFGTKNAPTLPYEMKELAALAKQAVERSITVPGVQPKLSIGLIQNTLDNKQSGRLTILDALGGEYILKPQNKLYAQMPENEFLSMRLAELFRIKVVSSSLIRLKSGELCYITKRIDRKKMVLKFT